MEKKPILENELGDVTPLKALHSLLGSLKLPLDEAFLVEDVTSRIAAYIRCQRLEKGVRLAREEEIRLPSRLIYSIGVLVSSFGEIVLHRKGHPFPSKVIQAISHIELFITDSLTESKKDKDSEKPAMISSYIVVTQKSTAAKTEKLIQNNETLKFSKAQWTVLARAIWNVVKDRTMLEYFQQQWNTRSPHILLYLRGKKAFPKLGVSYCNNGDEIIAALQRQVDNPGDPKNCFSLTPELQTALMIILEIE